MLVFDTDSDSFWYFDGIIWRSIDKLLLEDTDQDTKVQVEESADEDVIRFDVEGIEVMRHDGKTLHAAADGESLFIGVDAGVNDDGTDDGLGNQNTFIGTSAGNANTVGIQNTFLGAFAGAFNVIGSGNTFLGRAAGYQSTGAHNTFVGNNTAFSNTTGSYNHMIGFFAGFGNTEGAENHFAGYQAGYSNTTASKNYFSGFQAGFSNTTVGTNHFSGYKAGYTGIGPVRPSGLRCSFVGAYRDCLCVRAGSSCPGIGRTHRISDSPLHFDWPCASLCRR